MAQNLLSNPQIVVNGITIFIVPNSFKYTEGLGEDTFKVQSGGGGATDVVYGRNVEKEFSEFSFEVEPTDDNIELIKTWKINNPNNNVTAHSVETDFSRSFRNVALTGNYEVLLGADKMISLEFKSTKAA